MTTETYDVEAHLRWWKWMLGCFAVMFCFWVACWWVSWTAAVFAILSNIYFVFGVICAMNLYPRRKDQT